MILAHAFCCEAPFAVLEGLLKASLYFLAGTILAVASGVTFGTAFSRNTFGMAGLYYRECAMFFFSALTLMVPCSAALTVYSQAGESVFWGRGGEGRGVGAREERSI